MWVDGESIPSLLSSHKLSFSISCQPIPLFFMSSSSWLNHLVLGHLIGFFSLNSILISFSVSSLHPFFLYCQITVTDSILFQQIFNSIPLCYPSIFLKNFICIAWILLLFQHYMLVSPQYTYKIFHCFGMSLFCCILFIICETLELFCIVLY
jgi:hypothetical protein